MNRMNVFTALITLVTAFPISSIFTNGHTESKSFSGVIIEKTEWNKVFYLQDIEGGDVIELAFENEFISDLNFDEFQKVEIYGLYDRNTNTLEVSEIELE